MNKPDDNTLIPHEVVSILVDQDCNLAKAWRLYLGLTQKDVASRARIDEVLRLKWEDVNLIKELLLNGQKKPGTDHIRLFL